VCVCVCVCEREREKEREREREREREAVVELYGNPFVRLVEVLVSYSIQY